MAPPSYNEVNPLAAQHTKLAIKPNRTKWDTLLLDVLPKSVPHSRAAAKLQGLLRGARERRRGEPPGWYRKLNAEARALAQRVAAVGEETHLEAQALARSATTDGKMDAEPEWLKRAGSILRSQDMPPPKDKMRAVEKPKTVAARAAGAQQAVANRQAETREDAAARAQARTLAKWLAEKEADAAAKAEAKADAAARVEAQVLASVVAAAKAEAQAFARLASEAKAEAASAARAEARALVISASASATASKIAGLAAAAAAEADAAAIAETQALARRQAAAEALAPAPANLSLMTDDERPDLGEWQRRMLEAREASSLPLDHLRDYLSLMGAVGAILVAVAVAVCLMLQKGSVKERAAAKFEKLDTTWHVVLLPTPVGSRGSVQSDAPKGPTGPRPLLNSAEAVKQLLLSISLLTMSATPNVTADYQSLLPDAKPALGRGYSLTTHGVFSTCLDFTEKPMPTQSYSEIMLEFTHDGKLLSDSFSSMDGSASWRFVRSTIAAAVSAKPEIHSKKHYVATTRPAELSSSMIDERTATLTQDALALVERGDLVGFFQACGTGVIRSIRRTTELAAVFEFSSPSVQSSQDMAAFFKDGGASRSTISVSNDSSTTIKVKGFGLSLNPEGADTLVAHNFEDYNNAVKFATSTQSDSVNMIYAVEVVSWANNLQFKNAVNFRTQELVQHEAGPDDGTDFCNVVRKDDGQPVMVEAVEIKAMTMINAEYITGLDAIYHKEMDAILKFIACQSKLSAMIDTGSGNSKLLDHSSNHMGMSAQTKAEPVTVADAEKILSPRQLEIRKDSLEVFVEHFYGKCAMQMTKHSDAGGMVKYWWDFDECMPAANGTQHFSLECLDAGRSFEHDGNQLTCPVHQVIDQKPYGIDHFLEKFCMPQVVDSSVLNG